VCQPKYRCKKSYLVHLNIDNKTAWRPAEGAYSAPPDRLAGGEGAGCRSTKTPPPLSAQNVDTKGRAERL